MDKLMAEMCPIKIENVYAKNKLLRPEQVEEMREWIKTQPKFPQIIPDGILSLFIEAADYDVDIAKSTLHHFLRIRSEESDLFSQRDPDGEGLKLSFSLIETIFFLENTPDNYPVVYTSFIDANPSRYDYIQAMKGFFAILECKIIKEGMIPGIHVVLNANGVSYRHLFKVNVSKMIALLHYVQDAIPVKILGIHLINVNSAIDKLMYLIKPFIRGELMNKMTFYTTDKIEKLYQIIPKEIFPVDLGGNMGTKKEMFDECKKNLTELQDWLKLEEKYLRLKEESSKQ